MPFEITIPRLGWSMEEGTFVRWLKSDGDAIRAGDAVFELEGEKAAQDVEAVDSGVLRIPPDSPAPGTVVAVGAVIGFLVVEGESIPASCSVRGSTPVADRTENGASRPNKATGDSAEELPAVMNETPPAAPSVRRMAREMGVAIGSVVGSGPAGRITASDVRSKSGKSTTDTTVSDNKVATVANVASPRARRVASELGVDWRGISGTGRDGRVRESDVRGAIPLAHSTNGAIHVPVSSRRRTIATRMLASCHQTAPVTLTTRIDATNLVSLRQQFKQSNDGHPVPSFSDIVIKLVTFSLRQHPFLAARTEGDHWILPQSPNDIHIGFAVDTNDGLVVPVIQQAGSLSLFDIARRSIALIEKARSAKLSVSEMQGGVFTITNLGSFGIDAFTPIINLPETAVLGLGRIRREPVVVGDQIVARDQMTLSLTVDHRIVDGAPAAKFLQTLGQAIENPSAWLLRDDSVPS